ncbi:MAG: bifunctional (p)ppGpp synthetase/guanosine-3',5'-bis(diphosphate) 3'-pyrophosphohydrolase [Betaproteobacteria bacterium]|nr:bifunctional (p)ppGpp synthetase/guanosine-3',5'-bis(diphosphate) 3'-pyrophosphohydrolase [Betaproteobacteria bacterium]
MQFRHAQLLKAIAFAAQKHRHQRRKDPQASPYINHPIDLANVLLHEGGVRDTTVLIAAILHDTLEDTETTPAELAVNFGGEIRDIVLELTDNTKLKRRKRKELQIKHGPHLTRKARLVKLADKICNLRDVAANPPTRWSLKRQIEYFDWAKAVVDSFRGTHVRLERIFDRVYEQRPHAERWTRHVKPAVRGPRFSTRQRRGN